MAGVLPAKTIMNKRPVGRGQVKVQSLKNHPWGFKNSLIINAHEFHHADLILDKSKKNLLPIRLIEVMVLTALLMVLFIKNY